MVKSSQYKNMRHRICTVAMYGSEGPFLFDGHLTMKVYYQTDNPTQIDSEKSSEYLVDNLFYEVNKVLRMQRREDYAEPRELTVMSNIFLSEPYRIIYNLKAYPSNNYDNLVDLISNKDPYARGTCIIMKQLPDKTLTWLTIEEAKEIEKSLEAMM